MGVEMQIPIGHDQYRERTTTIERYVDYDGSIKEFSYDSLRFDPGLQELLDRYHTTVFMGGCTDKEGNSTDYPVLSTKYRAEKLSLIPYGTVFWVEGVSGWFVRSRRDWEEEHKRIAAISDLY